MHPIAATLAALGFVALATPGLAHEKPCFPPLVSETLNEDRVDLPVDFQGMVNLLLIAFERDQQAQINSWLSPAALMADDFPGFDYYELPVLGRGWRLLQGWIDSGMRSGIPDPAQRARTISIYSSKTDFMEALHLEADDRIYALLIDESHCVVWRTEGPATDAALAELEEEVAARLGADEDGA